MPRFPDIPMFQGIQAPSRIELDLHDIEADGDIPRELNGAFYRVAPDHQYPPRFLDDVPFNADGAISRFLFDNGRVHLRHRYVQTERFKLERAAGRALYGKYRNPFSDDPSVAGKSRNLANTTPLVWEGKLLALREDSPPIALDPVTLQTEGDWRFHGTLEGPAPDARRTPLRRSFLAVVAQIAAIDIVFSLDSVFTAVGLVRELPVMVAAIVVAIIVMMWVSGSIAAFIARHPTIRMLALSFLLLIGVALVGEALHFEIPKGYLYFAMAFATAVELINVRVRRRLDARRDGERGREGGGEAGGADR